MNKIIYNIFFTILFKSFKLFGQRSNLIKDKSLYNKRIEYVSAYFESLKCTSSGSLNDLYYSVLSN